MSPSSTGDLKSETMAKIVKIINRRLANLTMRMNGVDMGGTGMSVPPGSFADIFATPLSSFLESVNDKISKCSLRIDDIEAD